MSHQYDKENIEEYKKIFLSFDKDNDCKITLHSLKTVMQQLFGNDGDSSQYLVKISKGIRIDFKTFLTFVAMYELEMESMTASDDEENHGKIFWKYSLKKCLKNAIPFLEINLTANISHTNGEVFIHTFP